MTNVWQFVGYKNSGKTTLISSLIPLLKDKGFKTAVIKHDVHGFTLDHPGTDTNEFHEAGADGVAITSPFRTAVIHEEGARLQELIISLQRYDLILVEGFKQEAYPKLLLLRSSEDIELLDQVSEVRVLVLNPNMDKNNELLLEFQRSSSVPIFDWNEVSNITEWMCQEMNRLRTK